MNSITHPLFQEALIKEAFSGRTNAAFELRIRHLIDHMHDASILTDEDGRFLHVNQASADILGYTTEELLDLSASRIVVSPRHHAPLWRKLKRVGYERGTIQLKRKDGRTIACQYYIWSHIIPGRHSAMLEDISERLRMEESVRESEHQFRLEQQRFSDMFSEAPVGMCILKGPGHVFEKTNSLFDKLVGRYDLIGRPVRQAFPELEGQGWFELLDQVYRTGETAADFEKLLWILDTERGGWKHVYLNFMYQPFMNPQGEIEGIFYFGVDITEQVVSRKRIEESESRYRQIVETAQEGIWLLDRNNDTIFVNKKMGEILGYDAEEMVAVNLLHFIDPTDSGSVEKVVGGAIPENAGSFEMRFVSKCGKRVWGHLSTTRITESSGVYTGFLAMVTDITERKKADEELKKLSLIARSTTHAIIITNPSGEIEWVNEAFTRITGFECHEVIGRTRALLYGDGTDPATQQFIGDKMQRREPFVCEIVKYTKGGTPFWVEIQGRPVFDKDGHLSYYFNMETDISERKHAYEKLLKTENQVRIFARELNNMLEDERSRLAREIHDEFGQQLMGLKMSLSFLEKLPDLPGEAGGVIRELLSGVESSFQTLRNFSTELRPGILDTLGLVPSIEWLARGFEKKSGIRCVVSINTRQQVFAKDFSINYFRICQEALTNILKHAQATEVKITVIQQGESLFMEIGDNGRGMLNEKVENPFSLGLLGMKERARLIGGDLEIFSQPEQGTRIQLKGKIDEG